MAKRRSGMYAPELDSETWEEIRGFVTETVATVSPLVSYPIDVLLHTVTHHVAWAHSLAGYPLEVEAMFRRDVIGVSVAMIPTRSPSTMGRHRSILLRVGEATGVIDVPVSLPPLSPAEPTEPYSEADISQLRSWAYLQGDDDYRQSAQALLALGLGAGLPTRDICRVRAIDVDTVAGVVTIRDGDLPRSIRVDDLWRNDLAEVVDCVDSPTLALFRPGVAFHKNIVLTFLQRSMGSGLKPSTQRMRSTWLVNRLNYGYPMGELLYEAGLTSMRALVRYQRFVPPRSFSVGPGKSEWLETPPGFAAWDRPLP
ncbi:MAG: hypothetical protein ABWX92_15770 [Mycetocola sp.]